MAGHASSASIQLTELRRCECEIASSAISRFFSMLFSRPATATRDRTLPPRARPGQTKCDTERDKVEAPGVSHLRCGETFPGG